jgi:hypothetical protein
LDQQSADPLIGQPRSLAAAASGFEVRTLVLVLFVVLGPSAAAAPGSSAAVHPNYRNHFDMVGVCTESQGNKESHFWKSGFCQTIFESLSNLPCVAEKVEQIRLRFLGDADKLKAGKVKNTRPISFGGIECKGLNNPNEENLEELAKDPHKFKMFLMQMFAMLIIEGSDWRVNAGGDASQKTGVKCESNCGLFGLNKADMDKDKYSCGCRIKNKVDNEKQADPTMDGHLNIRCGITMALFEATDDKENEDLLGGGKPKGKGQAKDDRTGMARIFRALETREDKTPDQVDTPIERLNEKMNTYCKTEAFSKNNINRWRRIQEDSKGSGDLNSTTTR